MTTKRILPALRQQHPSSDGFCYSLSDFINTENVYLVFATIVEGSAGRNFLKQNDLYQAILVKSLSDRLAEAAAEWLHYKLEPSTGLRFMVWMKDILKEISGIGPAVGYPSS